MKRLGVDVGGTFTDLIYVDDDTGRTVGMITTEGYRDILHIDEGATEARRAELRAQSVASSLGDYFSGRGLIQSSAPVSVAGNAEFGI